MYGCMKDYLAKEILRHQPCLLPHQLELVGRNSGLRFCKDSDEFTRMLSIPVVKESSLTELAPVPEAYDIALPAYVNATSDSYPVTGCLATCVYRRYEALGFKLDNYAARIECLNYSLWLTLKP